jgi:hypothetical protein
MMPDYIKFYNLEQYLFGEVKKRFHDTGDISPLDFLLILHWKSARARTKAIDRLKKIVGGDFDRATKEIALSLYRAPDSKKRLELLMNKWQFRLPTATAILTVLYPDEFTIYDVRVREVIGFDPIKEVFSETSWPQTWDDYNKFKKCVIQAAPANLSLRDKDRHLWGKSLSDAIKCDLRR